MADVEAGTPTVWDSAWREGHAKGLEHALGISYREAFQRTMAMLRGEPLDTSNADVERPVTVARIADGQLIVARHEGVQAQNSRGQWVPAIPLPLFTWPHRHRCACGRPFWTMGGYRGHYALVHVMGLDTEAVEEE